MTNTYKPLADAVATLASGTADLQQRIENAWQLHLCLLMEGDFPTPEAKAEFADIHADCSVTSGSRFKTMGETELQQLAYRICELFCRIARIDKS